MTAGKNDKLPSGMSVAGMRKIERLMERLQMRRIGFVSHPLGDIFIAERKSVGDDGVPFWEVAWAARDMFSSLDCKLFTTERQRIDAAKHAALGALATYRKVEIDVDQRRTV